MKLSGILIPALSTLAVLALVTALHPPSDDFHPLNPQWNGMERVARELDAASVRIAEIYALDPSSYTLLIVGPCRYFAPGDANAVETFLAKGGRVIIADDYGTANQLLEMLGAPVRIASGVLMDPLLNLGSPQLPLAWWGPRRVALNYAAALNISACPDCRILAESSLFSYLDLNLNSRRDAGEPEGTLPVAVSLRYGSGELVVIADSSLFINSMIDREDNLDVLRGLLRSSKPAVVTNVWCETAFSTIKSRLVAVHRVISSPEIKYSLAAAILALSIREGHRLTRRKR